MARITPIDVIQGISGKYGSGSSDYFATNSSSNRIRLAKYKNKYTGPFTQDQKDQMEKFGTQAKLASAWLRANRPTNLKAEKGTREHDGTEAYQEAQALKRQMHLSNVRQVVIKYMAEDGTVTLPSGETGNAGDSSNPSNPSNSVQYTLSASVNPTGAGSITGAGQYNKGAVATLTASANTGFEFSQWSDGVNSATRYVTMDGNKTLTAMFTAVANSGEQSQGSENQGSETEQPDESQNMH